jgi:glycosyltransferase involved in cell wall biosynthesis
MDDEVTISVLLPVHAGVDPMHLSRALQSLVDQTRAPDEVVVVEDGPVGDGLRLVIDRWVCAAVLPSAIVRIAENSGAGVANGAGLRKAKGDWIAKADADDINCPERIERQLAFVLEAGVDVCGAAMAEFHGDEDIVTAIRTNPLGHNEIARRMPTNNPVNHPTAFYRRGLAVRAGGYSNLRFMQDYDLFARMMAGGARFANLSEPLVKFRADEGMYKRRASWAMIRCEWELQRNLHEYGTTGLVRRWVNLAGRVLVRLLPSMVLKRAYTYMLRSNYKSSSA